ncbi:MAG: hypothetical protein ACYDHW_09930 [Syntrophorhabdaceae bacterium]
MFSIRSWEIRLALLLLILILTASCATTDCAYDIRARPDPIYLEAEDGVVYGQNYVACFVMNGIVYKEYIPECAYRYYYERLYRYK